MLGENRRFKDILRLVLALALVWYLPSAFYLALNGQPEAAPRPEKELSGMGGPEIPLDSVDSDGAMDLAGAQDAEPEGLSRPGMLLYSAHTVVSGDNLDTLARNNALYTGTLISVNDVKNARSLQIGQMLRIPNQDGQSYKVKKGDSLDSIIAKHTTEKVKIDRDAVIAANELFGDKINENTRIFIPGAKMDEADKAEVNGDTFLYPLMPGTYRFTSGYRTRNSPFTGAPQFHNGIDLAAPQGTPIYASMEGVVIFAGYDNNGTYGNYVKIKHSGGYQTLYGHMSEIKTQVNATVTTDTIIGYVGATGLATGPHVHFTVYKWGYTVSPTSYSVPRRR
jgi:murein DD-endopeptidase MepM/ murein hydrolase activator NlpD